MKFLLIRHLDIEPALLIGEVITGAGHTLHTIDIEAGDSLPMDAEGFDGMVVMGGPMSANDTHLPYISHELEMLKHSINNNIPVIGICLGSQLLARAAGGEVIPSPRRELGWHTVVPTPEAAADPLFATLPEGGMQVFQWHGETFTLPEGAVLLATCDAVPHQAFRLGRLHYGLQFHIEVDVPVIESWIEAGVDERAALGADGVGRIRNDNGRYLPDALAFCRAMTEAWLRLAASLKGGC